MLTTLTKRDHTHRIKRLSALFSACFFVVLLVPNLIQAVSSEVLNSRAESNQVKRRGKIQRKSWKSCLPSDVHKSDRVVSDMARVTVESTLNREKARCSGARLVDRKGREIRFVHPLCWGNPPADAEEQEEARNREIAELSKKFRVILLGCDPLTQ